MARPSKLKLHDFSEESFMLGTYIPENICDDLVKFYHDNPQRQVLGHMFNPERGRHVDKTKKDSTDLSFFRFKEFQEIDDKVMADYFFFLEMTLREYEYKYTRVSNLDTFGITEPVNLQGYAPGGGAKMWHCERAGYSGDKKKNGDSGSEYYELARCLVFMTFLNDVPDGGTEFMYQHTIAPAKKGLTIIWPSDWTHTHRGQIDYKNEKYIITGWYSHL